MTRRTFSAVVATAAYLCGELTAAQPKCGKTVGLVTELGITAVVPQPFTAANGAVQAYPVAPQAGSRYIRARIEMSGVPNCSWYLSVRDHQYRLIHTLTEKDFPAAGLGWTRRVPGGQVLFDLQPCANGMAPAIRFDSYVWMPLVIAKDRPYYSWQGPTAAYTDVAAADTAIRRYGDFVAFLIGSWDRQSWVCSAVAIAPELILTNWHCGGLDFFKPDWYWNDTLTRDLIVDLSWDGDAISREFSVERVVAASESLDYALLRVRPIEGSGRVRPARIALAQVGDGAQITVVHHAEGLPKQVSSQCAVRHPAIGGWRDRTSLTEFTHLCDTESGSSGGAVFNAQGELVGLHHLGFEFDRSCKPDGLNKAVHLTHVLADIAKRAPGAHAEIKASQPTP